MGGKMHEMAGSGHSKGGNHGKSKHMPSPGPHKGKASHSAKKPAPKVPTAVTSSLACAPSYHCAGSCDANNKGSCLNPGFGANTCANGWWGVDPSINSNTYYATVCDTPCPTTSFCASSGCDPNYGTCYTNFNGMCQTGWWGTSASLMTVTVSSRVYTCDQACPTSQHCALVGCDSWYGTCLTDFNGMCATGWWGTSASLMTVTVSSRVYTCDQACPTSQHCALAGCDSWYGTCLTDFNGMCTNGWWGLTTANTGVTSRAYICSTSCDTTVSQHCLVTNQCDNQYGTCVMGAGGNFCVTGWWGHNSQFETFTCDQPCNCAGCTGCDAVTGECFGCP